MPTSYKDRSVLVIDQGLFVHLAVTLAESFGRTYYFTPWESAFPKSNHFLPGYGLPGIVRPDSIWDVMDEVDLVVFPDVNFGPLQEHLVSIGKRVWGSRRGEELELDRDGSKQLCRSLGIDIGDYVVVTGMDNLRDHLRDNDNVWVKVSRTRGDMETFRSPNYRLVEPKLDEVEQQLGAKKQIMQFIVEDSLEPAVEIGYDGFSIDGRFASNAMFGTEIKDRGLILECVQYDRLPWQLLDVNVKLASTFRALNYRGFFSSEVRATPDGRAYLIDPCCRMGSPPGELFDIMVTNWPDILWNGAEGVVVEPDCAARYGAELLIHSAWADQHWQPIDFPDSIRNFVKLRNHTRIGGRDYVIPSAVGLPEIGAVVAIDDTLEGAIAKVREYAEQVEGYYVDVFADSLDEAATEHEASKQIGRRAREAA